MDSSEHNNKGELMKPTLMITSIVTLLFLITIVSPANSINMTSPNLTPTHAYTQTHNNLKGMGYGTKEITTIGVNRANTALKLGNAGMSKATVNQLFFEYGDDVTKFLKQYPNNGAKIIASYTDDGVDAIRNFEKTNPNSFKWKPDFKPAPNKPAVGFNQHYYKHIDEFADLGITTKQQYSDVTKEIIEKGLKGNSNVKVGLFKFGSKNELRIGFFDTTRKIFISTDMDHKILTSFIPEKGAKYVHGLMDWVILS